jgi:DNA polymerase-3 subunit alpha
MKTLLFIKIESNGLPKNNALDVSKENLTCWPNLISIYYKIGKINTETNKVDISLQSYHIVKPTFQISIHAQKVHELSEEEMNSSGEDIKDILNKMNKDITDNDVKIIIGHNILFDVNITKAEILRNDLEIDLDKYDLVDTMTYKHEYKRINLEKLYMNLYDRKFKKSHKRKSLINIIIKCFEHLYVLES